MSVEKCGLGYYGDWFGMIVALQEERGVAAGSAREAIKRFCGGMVIFSWM